MPKEYQGIILILTAIVSVITIAKRLFCMFFSQQIVLRNMLNYPEMIAIYMSCSLQFTLH